MTPPLFEDRQPVEMCNLTPLFSYTFLLHLFYYSFLLHLFSYTLFVYTLFSYNPGRGQAQLHNLAFASVLLLGCILHAYHHCKPVKTIAFHWIPLPTITYRPPDQQVKLQTALPSSVSYFWKGRKIILRVLYKSNRCQQSYPGLENAWPFFIDN